MAESIRQLWCKKCDSVNALSTKVIDSIPLSRFHLIEYSMQIHNAASTKVRTLKMMVARVDTGVDDQVFARGGSAINLELNNKITGRDFELEIVNNETESVDLSFARLTL